MFTLFKIALAFAFLFVAFMVYCGYRHNLRYFMIAVWICVLDIAAHFYNSFTGVFRRPRHRVTRDGRIVKMRDSRGRNVTLDESEKFYHG